MVVHLRKVITATLVIAQGGFIRSLTPGHYDFVIIGGGTSGLAVARRLSELPDITVAVIEAGKDERNNPNVTSVQGFGLGFDTPIDWHYQTTEQVYAANQVVDYHAGKALGGTSTINGMTYIRAESVQIDAWETLGNYGWNWRNLYPYYIKSEQFASPTKAQVAGGASYVDSYHGRKGPLKVGYQYGLHNGSFASVANETWQNLGLPFNPDVNGGKMRGFFVWPQTLDREANVREDAARAYYYPVESKPNLVVLRGVANKIKWSNSNTQEKKATAEGVEYTRPDGKVATIYADKEVILSAGSIRSPAILELSGIGNPEILKKYNIPVKVSLSSVGENAQDQPNTSLIYSSNSTFNGIAPYVTYVTASDIFGADTRAVAESTAASLEDWARLVAKTSGNATSFSAISHLFQIQHDLIFKQDVPSIEILTTGSGNNLVSAFWILLPFSRGNVHISSADPLAYPVVNPNYFMVDWDLTLQKKITDLAVQFWETKPVQSLVVERTSPPPTTVPGNATDKEWETWIKSSFSANHHLLGTTAMLPEELGGVVDQTLTVYGTENVRVIDASILPAQVSGHLTSTLYAIAERAANIIKQKLDGH